MNSAAGRRQRSRSYLGAQAVGGDLPSRHVLLLQEPNWAARRCPAGGYQHENGRRHSDRQLRGNLACRQRHGLRPLIWYLHNIAEVRDGLQVAVGSRHGERN